MQEIQTRFLVRAGCPPLLASFENCQIALEFSGKDIKIRKENITEYRIDNGTERFVIYETSGKLKTMESL